MAIEPNKRSVKGNDCSSHRRLYRRKGGNQVFAAKSTGVVFQLNAAQFGADVDNMVVFVFGMYKSRCDPLCGLHYPSIYICIYSVRRDYILKLEA